MKIFMLADPESIHTKKWVSSLAQKDIDIFLYGLSNFDENYYSKYSNVQVVSDDYVSKLKNRTINGALNKVMYLKSFFKIKKCLNNYKPDILHAHYASSYGLIGALLGFKKFIISVWGSDVYEFPNKSFIHKWVLKYNLKKAYKVLSTSKEMAVEISKYTGKRIQITPFGVDINAFIPNINRKDRTKLTIGTVKTLSINYGIDYLIRAYNIVRNKVDPECSIELLIVGEGDQKENLKKLAIELKIENEITFYGGINHAEVPKVLNLLDIYVALSHSESFGVAVVEASASAIPVVVSSVGGLKEVVDNEITGLVVPPQNEELAADAIVKLIEDKQLRLRLGQNGRKKVLKDYDWNKNVDLMVGIYKNSLST